MNWKKSFFYVKLFCHSFSELTAIQQLVVRSENNVSLAVRAEREEQGVMTRHSGAMSRKNNAAIHVQNQR
ncbi:MAG: hypothetical protein JSV88_13650, partial [Candidatus Aminicenantes bacterium]